MDSLTLHALHLGPGWPAFGDPASWVRYATILALATASGLLLAYHPVHRGRPLTLADVELRKTLIVYSAVGALIAIICATTPSMAFVIFGIGGLMRFRTDLGASKNTGHTMMATLIGLCWGLGLELVAAFATAYFWVMIYALERTPLQEVVIGGLDVQNMSASAEAYKKVIKECGGQITAHSKRFKKQEMVFVVRLPDHHDLGRIMEASNAIPDPLRGIPNWPEG